MFELVRDDVVDFVGGLENGMGATHLSRFVLVGGSSSIVEGSVAAFGGVPGRRGRGNAK